VYPSEPNKKLEELVSDIKECAEKILGVAPVNKKSGYSSDPIVIKLVAERQHLHNQLTSNTTSDRDETRRGMKRKRKDTRRRLVDIENKKADDQIEEIDKTESARRFFEANRSLAGVTRSNTITVHNSDGHEIHTDTGKADEAMRYFKQQLTEGVSEGLPAFIGEPQPLENPITTSEVSYAASRLKTNRACGPDNLQNELLKNADPCVYKVYAEAINNSFETQRYINSIGEGIITPLQKPGKPKGPPSSLRPLTQLNGCRKIFTLVTLRRIEQKLDDYTMAWQGGYKHGRSCADIVWAQRMLISVVTRKQWSYHKMGLDMSRAFDTVKRDTIINLLYDAGCSDDDIKCVQYLLSNTKLRVRVNSSLSEMFESLLGAFQGDSLSGKLFTLVLAAALHHLRAVTGRPNPPVWEGIPMEWQYSDDCEFNDEDKAALVELEKQARLTLGEWNLSVNTSKTEYSTYYIAKKNDKDHNNKSLYKDEPWRSRKLLGSLLCSDRDVASRCIKGDIAFRKFEKVWLAGNKISLDRRLRLYEAQVVSVMLYNSNSWCATNAALNKLDVTHRRHLRRILNIRWPRSMISNNALYKRCNVTMLSERVAMYRWRMLGHVLRSDENTAAHQALAYAVETLDCKGRRGAPQANLFTVLTQDLEFRHLYFRNFDEFNELRDIARCRACWRNRF